MFGWLFGSSCPLDPDAKAWVEARLLWLRDEFFPDPYDGSRPAVRQLYRRVCGYMGVRPAAVRLEFLRPSADPLFLVNDGGEAVPTEAAGLYEGAVIRVNESETADPTWPDSGRREPEYMTGPMFAYALALVAWVRRDDQPGWSRHLRSGVRAEFAQALRFLRKTGDSRLRPLPRLHRP